MTSLRHHSEAQALGETRSLRSTPLNVMGIALTAVSVGMAISALIEVGSTNRDSEALLISAAVGGVAGGALWWRTTVGQVRTRDIFAAVGWTWIVITLFGALPYIIAGTFASPGVDFGEQIVNAIFESASGYSCTGSTALTGDDFARAGRGMLMYRQATQFYGGMGVVVLAVAVLPFLGVGGLSLISAEAPGPSSDRLAPRVSETAKRLWLVYVLFTVAVAVAMFIVPGPSLYDSVAHSFSTAATGGFSPYPDSIGHYDSVTLEIVLIIAMVIGAANFSLHWKAANGQPTAHFRDTEFRAMIGFLFVFSALATALLWLDGAFSFATSLRVSVFNIVAIGTSTGYGNATGSGSAGDFVTWVPSVQILILLAMLSGGSTGSTSGGMKVMRMQVMWGHALRAIRRTQHPRAVIPVRHGSRAVPEQVVAAVGGFFLLYIVVIVVGVMVVTALGGGLEESIGAVVSAVGNDGPAFGEAGPTASWSEVFSQPARLVLAAIMLIGRLEILPMLLMFSAPWRAVSDRSRRG